MKRGRKNACYLDNWRALLDWGKGMYICIHTHTDCKCERSRTHTHTHTHTHTQIVSVKDPEKEYVDARKWVIKYSPWRGWRERRTWHLERLTFHIW